MSKPNEFKFNLEDLAAIAIPAAKLALLASNVAADMANADLAATGKSLQETKRAWMDKIDRDAPLSIKKPLQDTINLLTGERDRDSMLPTRISVKKILWNLMNRLDEKSAPVAINFLEELISLADKIDRESLRTADAWMNYADDMQKICVFFLAIRKIYGGYPYIKK